MRQGSDLVFSPAMIDESLYAPPRKVADAADCHFYHRMEIPGYGLTTGGMWDLRDNADEYLGRVDLAGKRVLEIGPASGFLTFYMESKGAEVVSVELPLDHPWDVVPDARLDLDAFVDEVRDGIEHVRNAYWFAHERVGSKARVYYGDIYNLPDALGHFDYAIICAVLLHVRDPLRVIEQCARLAENLVITDVHHPEVPHDKPCMCWFSTNEEPAAHVWWKFSPQLFVRFAEVLGYLDNTVSFHDQLYVADGPPRTGSLFTVVSKRGPAPTGAE
jgi:SAM-dependent methyltransferase